METLTIWQTLGIVVAAFILGIIIGRSTARNKPSSEPLATINMPPLESNSVQELLRAGRKIEAIKIYRQEHGVGLKEAKDAVDRMAMGMPLANRLDDFSQNDGQVDNDESQSSFGGSGNYASSTLDDEIRDLLRKDKKIMAIKRYREARAVGLKEAKNVVDRMEAEMR